MNKKTLAMIAVLVVASFVVAGCTKKAETMPATVPAVPTEEGAMEAVDAVPVDDEAVMEDATNVEGTPDDSQLMMEGGTGSEEETPVEL